MERGSKKVADIYSSQRGSTLQQRRLCGADGGLRTVPAGMLASGSNTGFRALPVSIKDNFQIPRVHHSAVHHVFIHIPDLWKDCRDADMSRRWCGSGAEEK